MSVRIGKRWLLMVPVVMFVTIVAGTWLYINVIEGDAPAALTLADATSSSAMGQSGVPAGSDPEGRWNIAQGSTVGYRVNEVLFGQNSEAVGRTSGVSGSITVKGTKVTDAAFTVDMTTVTSDQTRRDDQFNDRIMETSTYPTATFQLTDPVDLGKIPGEGKEVEFTVAGDLTLHGVTNAVSFDLTGRWTGSTLQVAGSIPVTFADYDITDPSFGGVVSTEDHGVLEFALNLEH